MSSTSETGTGPGAVHRLIEAHGVIGDQATAALIADDGTLDFLCWPRFDSPTVFASLLDAGKGGAWEISPDLDDVRRRQLYLPDTNVLITRFFARDGVGEITDFMPFPEPGGGGPRVVRRVRAVRGEVRFRMRCAPRFDYARAQTRATFSDEGDVLFRAAGGDGGALRLTASVPLRVEREDGGDVATATFTLRAGEHADFLFVDAGAAGPDLGRIEALFKACVAHWHGWVAQCTYRGRWREAVLRSALALKLLTSQEHGSIVAAATFGLPEAPGGPRNWDYRAVWIRDASFTVHALMSIGFRDEATAFIRWVGERAEQAGDEGRLQIMYGLDGHSRLEEEDLDLAGYDGTPVRIGNAAFKQVQLDIYGELLATVHAAQRCGTPLSHDGWRHVARSVEYVCRHWREPDQGIWEMRGPARHWLHSRVMCWVALDRAIRLAVERGLPAPIVRWHETRDAIYESVWAEFWNEERGCFVASADDTGLDGAMLILPLCGFISATDPRWLATLDAIGDELVDDPLVYRYRGPDHLEGQEGAFTPCSFLYVECLARAGRLPEARLMFEKMLGFATPLGLYSEEIGPRGEQLGNTPQALTHLTLISAAYCLDMALTEGKPLDWRL